MTGCSTHPLRERTSLSRLPLLRVMRLMSLVSVDKLTEFWLKANIRVVYFDCSFAKHHSKFGGDHSNLA